jgi:hypothetical protein
MRQRAGQPVAVLVRRMHVYAPHVETALEREAQRPVVVEAQVVADPRQRGRHRAKAKRYSAI